MKVEKILILDDSTFQRVMLSDILTDSYDVTAVSTFAEASKLLRSETVYNAFIISFIDPKSYGKGFLQEIRNTAQYQRTPVIAIIPNENQQELVQAFDYGTTDYLTKPFIHDDVIKIVASSMKAHDRYQEIINSYSDLNIENFDVQTGALNLDTTKWLIDEKIANKGDKVATFTLYQLTGTESINIQTDFTYYQSLINSTSNLILSHYESKDVIGRINENTFAVLLFDIKDTEFSTVKTATISRLIKQHLTKNYQDINLRTATTTVCSNDTFDDIYERAYAELTKEDNNKRDDSN